ncbi:unnamed protein product [Fusarium graminearum]|uniref:Uncharacterized protein n=1 Tax=Gibberella zeae TaxID=5518 RepID=A0A9N8WPG9_GIBZA|nr:unnamed protein product [Fusarium graminearum]
MASSEIVQWTRHGSRAILEKQARDDPKAAHHLELLKMKKSAASETKSLNRFPSYHDIKSSTMESEATKDKLCGSFASNRQRHFSSDLKVRLMNSFMSNARLLSGVITLLSTYFEVPSQAEQHGVVVRHRMTVVLWPSGSSSTFSLSVLYLDQEISYVTAIFATQEQWSV